MNEYNMPYIYCVCVRVREMEKERQKLSSVISLRYISTLILI